MSNSHVDAMLNGHTGGNATASSSFARDRTLWFAVFAPPVAWSLDLLVSIAVHHDYCAALLGGSFQAWRGIGALLTATGILMLVISLGACWVAARTRGAIGIDTGKGETHLDRRRFMARAGVITGSLFSYAIVLRIVAVFVVAPNICRL